jgi:lysophospholipase L1-like esterase
VSRSPLTRLAQLVSICLVAFFCGPLTAQGCVFHADNGQPYKVTWRFLPQAGVVQGSRLKVVALGDSVVWGDGDKPEHRIVTLVSKSLANNSGRPVELDSYAHSGARLQYAPGEPATFPVRRGVPVGDVDASRPTTEEQSVCAKVQDSDADYVLIDGCINEIGAMSVALPPMLGLNQTTTAEIRAQVLQYCATPMRNVLEEVLSEFPRAKIVLLNYFLVVSTKSEPKPEMANWTDAQKKRQQKEIDRALRKAASLEGKTKDHRLTSEDIKKSRQAWQDNSVEFLADTTTCFEWAIASASAGDQGQPTPGPNMKPPACEAYQGGPATPSAIGRIFLAQVSDDPNFSYGAPKSHLWLLPIPLLLGFAINPDEMFRTRNCECDRTHFFGRKDTSCKVNPIAHPKPAGGQCYARSILRSLGMPWNPPAREDLADCGDE